jgi:primosomal replication protein N
LAEAGSATVVSCSIDAVVSGIESALSDTAATSRIAVDGPATVRSRYSWDEIIPALIAHYAEVIDAREQRRPS